MSQHPRRQILDIVVGLDWSERHKTAPPIDLKRSLAHETMTSRSAAFASRPAPPDFHTQSSQPAIRRTDRLTVPRHGGCSAAALDTALRLPPISAARDEGAGVVGDASPRSAIRATGRRAPTSARRIGRSSASRGRALTQEPAAPAAGGGSRRAARKASSESRSRSQDVRGTVAGARAMRWAPLRCSGSARHGGRFAFRNEAQAQILGAHLDFGQIGPNRARLLRSMPSRSRHTMCRIRPNSDRFRALSTKLSSRSRPTSGAIRHNLARPRPYSTKLGPETTRFGPTSTEFPQPPASPPRFPFRIAPGSTHHSCRPRDEEHQAVSLTRHTKTGVIGQKEEDKERLRRARSRSRAGGLRPLLTRSRGQEETMRNQMPR